MYLLSTICSQFDSSNLFRVLEPRFIAEQWFRSFAVVMDRQWTDRSHQATLSCDICRPAVRSLSCPSEGRRAAVTDAVVRSLSCPLLSLADQLGSDVPFFIDGGTAYVSGRGNIVKKVSSNPKFYVLIFPSISISTKHIFGIISDRHYCEPKDLNSLLESEHNSFEEVVLKSYPELIQTKYWLSSFGKVRMSGTGSTLYIEFDSYESAIEANKEIGNRYRSKMVSSLESYDIFS